MPEILKDVKLTKVRERVLVLATQGLSDDQICVELGLSKSALRSHWRAMCEKSGQSRQVMVERMIRQGSDTRSPSLESSAAESSSARALALQFEAFIEVQPLATFVLNSDQVCVAVNSAWKQLTGLSARHAKSGNWFGSTSPEDAAVLRVGWRLFVEEGKPLHSLYRIVRSDGIELDVSLCVQELRAQGHVLGFVGVLTDLSNQSEAHELIQQTHRELATMGERLQASEERFRAFMDRMPGIAFIKDAQRRTLYLSKGFERAFNFPSTIAIGKRDEEFLPRSVARRTRDIENRLLSGCEAETSVEIDHSVVGSRRWLVQRFAFTEGEQSFIGGTSFEVTQLWEAEERFRACADASIDSLVIYDPIRDVKGKVADFAFKFFNPSARPFFGEDCEKLIGLGLLASFQTRNAKLLVSAFRKVLSTGASFQSELVCQLPSVVGRKVQIQAVRAGGSIAASIRDVTEERESQARLRETQELLRVSMDSLHQGVLLVDRQGRIVFNNPAAQEIFGCISENLSGVSIYKAPWKLVEESGRVIPRAERPITRALAGHRIEGFEQVVVRRDGQKAWIRLSCEPVFLDGCSKPTWAVISFVDVTQEAIQRRQIDCQLAEIRTLNRALELRKLELEKANRHLAAIATTDALTGLMNQGRFKEVFEEQVERAIRYARPLSVALMDFDSFKRFNDSFGHLAGDDALRTVAKEIRTGLRSSDIAARYGGEEFAIIMPETSLVEAFLAAERYRKNIERLENPLRKITVSIGVATISADLNSTTSLLEAADKALYQAKAEGRNRTVQSSLIPKAA